MALFTPVISNNRNISNKLNRVKMKQKVTFPIFALLILLFIFGCDKATEPDTTPPQVSIASPIHEASVRDSVKIITIVADNDGIDKVEFYIAGELLSSVTSKPYETFWDTRQATNGQHNLQCKAIDNAGNETLSDIVEVTVTNYLFKATFKDNWLSIEDGQAIVFISDMDGNVLAEKTWSGNDSFEMFIDVGLNKSGVEGFNNISVTTVTNNRIITNMNIPIGSSWTWKGYPSSQIDYDNPYVGELDFQNVPEHVGYTISSKWTSGSSNSGTLSNPLSYSFYESPMDIYIKLNTINNGVKYIWLNDVVSGSRQDNLSNMENTNSKTISFSGNSGGFRKYLDGFINNGNFYEGRHRLDSRYDIHNIVNSVNVYYPENSFSDYKTSLYIYDDSNTDNFWSQSIYGEIPSNFTKINADFEFTNTSYDNFEMAAAGEFLSTFSSWGDGDSNYWSLYGDETTLQYKLPNLPYSVFQLFGFNRESFNLIYAELGDHSELNSYSEKLDILFKSDNYLYEVINDYRGRVKYFNGGNLSKQYIDGINFEEIYENSSLIHIQQ
jgi:hypothetical protein